MTKRDLSEQELEALFAAQQVECVPVSERFLARIAQDAAQAAEHAARPARPAARASLRSSLFDWLWTLSAPGGVVAAGLVGLWIGLSGPQIVPDPALLWSLPSDLSAVSEEVWLGMQDLDSMEWDDG